ncbi:MAG TPA: PKD domain-containing protein [Pedobacter sp.]|uniref:PKD domain-containing protein n=1 Tax=Pedobacter sp. TaxID=1411316 RepID=UPI002B8A3A34|nr:PKD domain-containing protein [Pedobacter sp.]HMI02713.1 PKD domain-containing protein [Pedobacter sp.]
MNRLIKPISFLIVALTIASCSKNKSGVEVIDEEGARPFVDYQITDGDDPFTFDFKNKSTSFKSLQWRFGDDSVATEDSPKHVYLSTGIFEVNLTAVGETGTTAKKLVKINIRPDDVVAISAVKTGTANEIRFVAEPKKGLVIQSIEWSFTEVSPAVKSTELSPTRTYAPGSFNSFSVKITSSKGSVINFSKFVTPEGVAENITSGAAFFPNQTNPTNVNEVAQKVVDGNLETKTYIGGAKLPVIFKFTYTTPQTVKIYGIGNGNDSPSRDPKSWVLEGSNDDLTWEVVDSRTQAKNFYDQRTDLGAKTDGERYKKMFYFAVANPKPFLIYKWTVNTVFSTTSTSFQISEFRLFR